MVQVRTHFSQKLRVAGTSEGDRVTTLELFFDLVYAFAFTQVTSLMAHGRAPGSVLDGLVVLSLLWFSWCAFSWLANQARADQGILQAAVIVAMIAVFIACLALPDAFHHVSHALDAAAVVVVCYAVVRVTHAAVYLVAANGDRRLRNQVIITVLMSLIPTLALLALGAASGGQAQRWIWLAAVIYDFASVFVTAKLSQGWVIRSAAHFSERHGLIVLLALGESIVAIATPLAHTHLTGDAAVGATLSILIALGLYLAYFGRVDSTLEAALDHSSEEARANLGRDIFTYLHYPVIAGVIITALGLEQAMKHLDASHLGSLGGWTLGGGSALFLAATLAAGLRCGSDLWLPRVVVAVLLVAISPLLGATTPLLALGIIAVIVLALRMVETATTDQRLGQVPSPVEVDRT